VALAALTQLAAPRPDTVAALRARVQADSSDARAWLELGRALRPGAAGLLPRDSAGTDAAALAALDSAEAALERAARLDTGAVGDSARALLVFAWGDRALLAWRDGGVDAAGDVWRRLPEDRRLPPVLEELGENLLRACPARGVLWTAGDADTYAAWYLRFARRLRTDVLVLPHAAWHGDTAFRRQAGRALGLDGRRDDPDAALRRAGERRPLCASMAFERPPGGRGVKWRARPLVWVAGRVGRDAVPPQDFVFAALRLSLDGTGAWAPPAVAVYRRAAAATPALCRPLLTFELADRVGCRASRP
jgi:hypothetical protein